ncbi:MAG TPA: hypothetical protein VMI75_32285 [Polyangiaceae bacterium]|nr:hypothetical protein [Polyangiaceae bacterium]
MRFLRRLLPFRTNRGQTAPIREDEAYARLHGERSGDIVSVVAVERKPIPRRTGDLTGELLRRAFEARLDARGAAH